MKIINSKKIIIILSLIAIFVSRNHIFAQELTDHIMGDQQSITEADRAFRESINDLGLTNAEIQFYLERGLDPREVVNQALRSNLNMRFIRDSSGPIDRVIQIMDILVLLIISLALLLFIWGLIKYGFAKSPDEQKNARAVIVYGIIILFVMVSIWALVNVVRDTFGVDVDTPTTGGSTRTIKDLIDN